MSKAGPVHWQAAGRDIGDFSRRLPGGSPCSLKP